MNREEATRAVRVGVIVATLITALSLLGILLAVYLSASDDALALFNDKFALLGVAAHGGLTLGLHLRSRFAAVLLPLVYGFERIMYFFYDGIELNTMVFVIGIALTLVLARAAQATFVLHKLDADEGLVPEEVTGLRRVLGWVWLSLVSGAFAVAVIMFAILGSSVLDFEVVVPGERVSDTDRALITQHGMLAADDDILKLYAWGFPTTREGGVFLSNEGITLFMLTPDEMEVHHIAYRDIDAIEELPIPPDVHVHGHALYLVESSRTDFYIQFMLPVARNGHNVFMDELKARTRQAR